jgi:hypothetical protein
MSDQMVSQKVKRTCDGCGAEFEWEFVNITEETLASMQQWYKVTRKLMVDKQPVEFKADACSLACVPAAAVKLALPPQQEEPADDIDLGSLRASNFSQPN